MLCDDQAAYAKLRGEIEALTTMVAWLISRDRSIDIAAIPALHEFLIHRTCSVHECFDGTEPAQLVDFVNAQAAAAASRYDSAFIQADALLRSATG